MRLMITLSMVLNLVVLGPVCFGLFSSAPWVNTSYGDATVARGILLSIYLAIGVVSALLLVRREPQQVAVLLLIQVVYKLTTPLTVGTLDNPVVLSNLAIAAFHTVTLTLIHRAKG
ncbi:MAG: hypothetical protein IGQ88_09055 [Gloeomargaritaceae cyanobacterium C42_A2020_066]|nr:hypothetical protein [Gloeomargaritaceae cyanobacterium C42_A2020_066]